MYQLGNWTLRWLGHDSFRLTNNDTTIYIDPYQVAPGYKADIILISHEHYDHLDPTSLEGLRKINTVIIGPESVTSQLDAMAIPLAPGETHSAEGVAIQATPAYNTNKHFHPKEEAKLGFILELDGQRLYHAGDTDIIPEMNELGPIDVALLPVSGTYVMTAEEAVEAVKAIKPKVAIPMHYGTIVGSQEDAERFAELAGDLCQVVILEKETNV